MPLAVWILEGFMSGVPKEIDETAYIDGYSFPKFFAKIFVPLIASGIGVAGVLLLHVLLGRAAARPHPDDDRTPSRSPRRMTRTVSAAGMDWGVLAAAGRARPSFPGALVIYFVRNYIAKGFALGRV